MNHLSIVRKREENFSKLWVQCQRCQDSLHQDVICSKYVFVFSSSGSLMTVIDVIDVIDDSD